MNFGDGSLITCSTCGTKYNYPNVCCTYHNPEKTVKFEVGDKVRIDCVVTTIDKTSRRIHVTTDEDTEEYFATWINPDVVTLVERPKKFEVGRRYKFGSRGSHTYMRLGDNQWFDYERDTTIRDMDLELSYLVELDS